jgi:polysaccharide export outer membrane protein
MKALTVAWALLLVLLASQVRAETAKPNPASTVEPSTYIIGPEDVLQIIVWKNETLTRAVPVRPDGLISLPLLHDVQAAGLTPLALRDVLTKRLTEFMTDPEVSVIVSDVRSFKVSVIGEVLKPGRYELKSNTTILDLVAQAGGFTYFSKKSKIVVLRPNGPKTERIPFNYNKAIEPGGESQNFYLQPNDIVLVP